MDIWFLPLHIKMKIVVVSQHIMQLLRLYIIAKQKKFLKVNIKNMFNWNWSYKVKFNREEYHKEWKDFIQKCKDETDNE